MSFSSSETGTKKCQDAEDKGIEIVDEEWVREKVEGDGDGDDNSGGDDGSGGDNDEAIEDRYEPPSPPTPYPVTTIFDEQFLANFWDDSTRSKGRPVTDEMFHEVEHKLGFKLPAAYIELIRSQNGGSPKLRGYRVDNSSSSLKRVDLEEVLGCDKEIETSLSGPGGCELMMDEWEYPRIGLYFANCPSGGHDMICLDYRSCGVAGEPVVSHVDQELDYRIVVIAPNFETFVRNLISTDED